MQWMPLSNDCSVAVEQRGSTLFFVVLNTTEFGQDFGVSTEFSPNKIYVPGKEHGSVKMKNPSMKVCLYVYDEQKHTLKIATIEVKDGSITHITQHRTRKRAAA